MRQLLVAALVLVSILLGASAAADPGDAMLEDASALVELGPRKAGSDGGRRGEQWVQARLDSMGLSAERFVVGHRETPAIAVFGRQFLPPRTVNVPDATLLVTLPATARADPEDRDAFLLLAHYDTVAGSPGAVDNAAAVSVGLELLRRLADTHRPRDVMVAFTACEETRLAGAHALADGLEASGRMPTLALSLDLVGLRGGTLTLNGLSRKLGAPWLSILHDAADAADVHLDGPLAHQVVSRLLPEIERSDHGVFSMRGVPAFHVYHRPLGRLYFDYHRETDTMEHVDPARLVEVADFVTALATAPEHFPDGPGPAAVWWLGTVWPKWLVIALELGLVGLVGLAFVRRTETSPPERPLGIWISGLVLVLAWAATLGVEAIVDEALGHPAPWAHAPAKVMLHLVLVAALIARGLLAIPWLARRPIGSDGRRTLVGAVMCAALGLALLGVGVFELAWLPLLAGAGLALTLRTGTVWLVVGCTAAALPPALALAPTMVREATYNGFLPPEIPITVLLAIVTFPLGLAAFDLAGRPWPPRAKRIATATLVGLVVATAVLATRSPPCPQEEFERDGLACERHAPM